MIARKDSQKGRVKIVKIEWSSQWPLTVLEMSAGVTGAFATSSTGFSLGVPSSTRLRLPVLCYNLPLPYAPMQRRQRSQRQAWFVTKPFKGSKPVRRRVRCLQDNAVN